MPFLSGFGLNETLNLLISITAIIPSSILFLQYRSTKIQEFLLFGMFFLISSISFVCLVLAIHYPYLILYQLNWLGFNSVHYLLFLHCTRLSDGFPRKTVKTIGGLWYTSLTLMILNWKVINHPDKQKIWGITIPHSFSTYYPSGAGFVYNDYIVYSSSYHLIGALFHIFVYITFIFAYLKVDPLYPTKEIILAKRLWIIGAIVGLIAWVVILPWGTDNPLVKVLPLVSAVIVAYIGLRIPEAMLISYSQILRASFVYEELKKKSLLEEPTSHTLDRILDYLNSLPVELVGVIEERRS